MTELDPITYEVLRHRLSSIAREGAIALQRVSGSPLATEAFDLNTSIMSATGEVTIVGPFLLTGPIGQGLILAAYGTSEMRTDFAQSTDRIYSLGYDYFVSKNIDIYVAAMHESVFQLSSGKSVAGGVRLRF